MKHNTISYSEHDIAATYMYVYTYGAAISCSLWNIVLKMAYRPIYDVVRCV